MATRRRQIAEPVLADANAGMNDHAVADQRAKHSRAGADGAIASDRNPRADHRAGCNQRARSDLGAGPDHRERIDRHARLDPRRGMHIGAPRAAIRAEQRGRPQCRRKQRTRHRDEGAIRLRRHQHRERIRRGVREMRLQQAGSGPRRGQLTEIFLIVEEADVGRSRRVQRSDVADTPVERSAGARLGTRERDDLSDRQLAFYWEEVRHAPAVDEGRGRDQNRVPPPNWNHCVRS